MTADGTHLGQHSPADRAETTADLLDRLNRFQGPPGEFLSHLLAAQCRLAPAAAGAIVRPGQDDPEVLAVYPRPGPDGAAPRWLAQAGPFIRKALAAGQTTTAPLHGPDDLYGQPAGRQLVMVPLRGPGGPRGLAAYVVAGSDAAALAAARDRLELSASLLELYETRLTLQHAQARTRRLQNAAEISAAVGGRRRFLAAAMALCNEVATRWRCERVAVGFLKGRYVRARALSHTEKFSRKTMLVRDIEAAMEECLDQDEEVAHPSPAGQMSVNRAAKDLSLRHGPTAVLSLPLRRDGEPVAVLTCERASEEPIALEEIESLRLALELCTPRLVGLYEQDRWFGARAASAARKLPAAVLGAKHTWLKLLALVVFAGIVFLAFAKGQYTAEAPFVLQTMEQQQVPAPFDGFLRRVYVEPNDQVVGAGGAPGWRLSGEHLTDAAGLAAKLRSAGAAGGAPSPARRVWSLLGPGARRAIEADPARPEAKAALLAGLNELLGSPELYEPSAWAAVVLTDRQKDLLADLAGGGDRERTEELNRSLLAAAFPQCIAPGPTVLAELYDDELRLELASARAEREGHLKRARAAMRDGNTAQRDIALAEAEQVAARIALLDHRVGKARIVSALSGVVVEGDLKKQIGGPVSSGDTLFQVAPPEALRAELSVPEDQIAEVRVGQRGELASVVDPSDRIGFEVVWISEVAEPVEQRNVFHVRARLDERRPWMSAVTGGQARIHIGRRRYLWIWTRKLANWLRMKLWI